MPPIGFATARNPQKFKDFLPWQTQVIKGFEMYFEVHHLDIPYAYEISTLQQH